MGKKSVRARGGARAGRARRARENDLSGASLGLDAALLPKVDELQNVPSFEDLIASPEQVDAFESSCDRILKKEGPEAADALRLGCVVRLDRGFPLVACQGRTLRAEHAVEFAKGASAEAGLMPTVGDWVALSVFCDHEMGRIEEVLPRSSAFARWRGGKRGEFQTLAANLDSLIVVSALGEGTVDLGRIARSLVLAYDCGLEPAVVLTKADRKGSEDELNADVRRVERLVGEKCPVVVTSAAESSGLEAVRSLVPQGRVAMILGESGAGKSTLLNALLGTELLATGSVREKDDRGRHTTVARMMVKLPDAGVICDAPGLRSLALVGHERGLALTFPEIAERAGQCRFRDCTHRHEPGCAVQEAALDGQIDAVRLEAYLGLAELMRQNARGLDPDILL